MVGLFVSPSFCTIFGSVTDVNAQLPLPPRSSPPAPTRLLPSKHLSYNALFPPKHRQHRERPQHNVLFHRKHRQHRKRLQPNALFPRKHQRYRKHQQRNTLSPSEASAISGTPTTRQAATQASRHRPQDNRRLRLTPQNQRPPLFDPRRPNALIEGQALYEFKPSRCTVHPWRDRHPHLCCAAVGFGSGRASVPGSGQVLQIHARVGLEPKEPLARRSRAAVFPDRFTRTRRDLFGHVRPRADTDCYR